MTSPQPNQPTDIIKSEMTTNVQARARTTGKSTTIAPVVILIAGWLVPGLGHLLLKKWIRASLIFVSILSMFLIGLALKGKVYSPNKIGRASCRERVFLSV